MGKMEGQHGKLHIDAVYQTAFSVMRGEYIVVHAPKFGESAIYCTIFIFIHSFSIFYSRWPHQPRVAAFQGAVEKT